MPTVRAARNGLQCLAQEFGLGEVRGQGLLLALELGVDLAPQVLTHARDVGLLLNAPRPHCLRFMPARLIRRQLRSPRDWQCCVKCLAEVLAGRLQTAYD